MLADIYKRLESIHVQSTCLINTPLITQCLQSPIVSRNAQLAKQHAPATKLDGTAKTGEKLGGTLGGSGGVKSSGKEKGAGTWLTPLFCITSYAAVKMMQALSTAQSLIISAE